MQNTKKINIRLTAFLTSFMRNKCASLALNYFDDVIRIYTDCCVFKNKYDDLFKTYTDLKEEDKSSGLIKWFNPAKYYNTKTNKFIGQWTKEEDKEYEIKEFTKYKINNNFLFN